MGDAHLDSDGEWPHDRDLAGVRRAFCLAGLGRRLPGRAGLRQPAHRRRCRPRRHLDGSRGGIVMKLLTWISIGVLVLGSLAVFVWFLVGVARRGIVPRDE